MNKPESASLEQPKQQKSPEEFIRPKSPAENVLETRDKTEDKLLGGGIHKTRFIKLKDDGAGIFKPKGEMYWEKEKEQKDFFKRERAAYVVDCFLGFDLVPPTVIRVIDDREGSFQQFIPDTENAYADEIEEIKPLSDQLMKLWIFDHIIANTDRHGGNLLIKDGRVYAIDNEFSFSADHSVPFRTFFGFPLSNEIKEKISRFLSWPDGEKILKNLLLELLPEDQAERCLQRIETVGKYAEKGFIPAAEELK